MRVQRTCYSVPVSSRSPQSEPPAGQDQGETESSAHARTEAEALVRLARDDPRLSALLDLTVLAAQQLDENGPPTEEELRPAVHGRPPWPPLFGSLAGLGSARYLGNDRWEFLLCPEPGSPADLLVDVVVFHDDKGALGFSAVAVTGLNGVTTNELRRVPLGLIARFIGANADAYQKQQDLDELAARDSKSYFRAVIPELSGDDLLLRIPPRTGGRYPDTFYADVARLWTVLEARGQKPAPTIAKANGVPETTVHNWAKAARGKGLLARTRRRA